MGEIKMENILSNYTYYKKCGYSEEISAKQSLFDSILKSIDTYLKNFQIQPIHNLKVNVVLEGNFLVTKINEIELNKKNCPFNLSEKDAYFFKNNVIYLIEDNLFIDGEEVQLNINFAR